MTKLNVNIIGEAREKNKNTGNYSVPRCMYNGKFPKKPFMFVDPDFHGEIFSYEEILPLITTIHKKNEDGTYINFGLIRKDDIMKLYLLHHPVVEEHHIDCYEIYGPTDKNINTGNISLSMSYVCGNAAQKDFHFNIPGLDKYLFPWRFVTHALFGMTDRAYRNVDKLYDKCCYISKARLFNFVKAHPDIKLYN